MNTDPKQLYTAELRKRTRDKLRGLECPVLILHGDVHALKKFNLGLFVPEMRELGKDVVVRTYPGEPHGFYWGRGRDPGKALAANRDAEAFLRKHATTAPAPIAAEAIRPVKVEPMKCPRLVTHAGGIEAVIVNGGVSVEAGELTGERRGQVIRGA